MVTSGSMSGLEETERMDHSARQATKDARRTRRRRSCTPPRPGSTLQPTAPNCARCAARRCAPAPRATALRLRGALLMAGRRLNARPLGGPEAPVEIAVWAGSPKVAGLRASGWQTSERKKIRAAARCEVAASGRLPHEGLWRAVVPPPRRGCRAAKIRAGGITWRGSRVMEIAARPTRVCSRPPGVCQTARPRPEVPRVGSRATPRSASAERYRWRGGG